MKVKHIMSRRVIAADPDMPIRDAQDLLDRHHISGMPVVDKSGHVLGVYSLSDNAKKQGQHIGEVMTTPAITVGEETEIEGVAALMAAKDINRVPVLRHGRLVGIVARANLIAYLATRQAWSEGEVHQRPE